MNIIILKKISITIIILLLVSCSSNLVKNGLGVYEKDGFRYEGQFANDQAHGEGVYTWPDGVRSEGEFREGKPWSVVGYDEHGKSCGLIIDGKYQEVYTDSHKCATQSQYQEKQSKILTQNRR